MDLCTLTAELTTRGLAPTYTGGKLAIAGPVERLTPALKAGLDKHRETLRAMLTPGAGGVFGNPANNSAAAPLAPNCGNPATISRGEKNDCNPAPISPTAEAGENFRNLAKNTRDATGRNPAASSTAATGGNPANSSSRGGVVRNPAVNSLPPENADGIPDIAFADTPAADGGLLEVGDYFGRLAADVLKRNPKQAANLTADPRGTPCRRCGFEPAVLTLVHQGASVRRDCATCGAFGKFTAWHDADAAAKAVADARGAWRPP